MKVINIGSPTLPSTHGTKTSATGPSARERAMAKLLADTSEDNRLPVSNPTRVSPEEMGALKPKNSEQLAPQTEVKSDEIYNNEAPVQATPEVSQSKEEPLSSQYAALARKEKALRAKAIAQEQAYKARELELKAKEDSFRSSSSIDTSKYVQKDKLQSDPFGVLSELGLTYDQLTQLALNAPSADQIQRDNEFKALKEEIKALRSSQEEAKKFVESREVEQRTQALEHIRMDASRLINSDPTYQTIKDTRSIGEVMKLIEKTFDQDGVLLTVEEAADAVENALVERYTKYAQLEKIKSRLAAPKKAEPATSQATQPQKPKSQTLTNNGSSSAPMSARDRAIAAMEGRLNK